MRPADPSLVDAIVRAADGDVDGADPLCDVVAEMVDLPGGALSLLRPRDPDALPFEIVSSPEAEVEELHPAHWARRWPSGTALAHAVEAGPLPDDSRPDDPRPDDPRPDDSLPDDSRPDDAASGDVPPGGAGGSGRSGRSPGARIVVRGRSVLELGCGLGLPALAAARAGAHVLATDRSPGACAHVAATAAREGIGLHTASCAWDDAGPLLEQGPWDVVLAADVLYGADALTLLTDLLPRLTADDGEVWLADPRRPLAPEFLAGARSRWLEVHTHDATEPGVLLHRLRGPVRPSV